MNPRIAKFFMVSNEQWNKDSKELGCKAKYEDIVLPVRKTAGSAGYDLIMSKGLTIQPKTQLTIPTGLRCRIDSGYVLLFFPRSSLGFKYGMRIVNTVGVIDSDYFHAKNEGHIIIGVENPSDKEIVIKPGDGLCQGIFFPFGITTDDEADGVRTGGIGSTDGAGQYADQPTMRTLEPAT